MIRKMICVLVAISLLAVLAACSSQSSDAANAANAANAADGASSEQAATSKEAESGTENPGQAGAFVSFETTDLDGNIVRSSDIFSKNMITMVNIWGTFCGPCIDELPELEKLRYRLEKKGCAIVGIVSDVESIDDSETIADAKELIDEIGVRYQNLIPWNETWDIFPAQFIPTTYFIDSRGQIIGEPAVGARSEDDYEELIDALIEKMQ